eukprot:Colp12_sorted_trinity150504_noHs@11864
MQRSAILKQYGLWSTRSLSTLGPQHRPKAYILYDGGCPLCLKEITFLKKRAEKRDARVLFFDIYNLPKEPLNVPKPIMEKFDLQDLEQRRSLMFKMHGLVQDGPENYRVVQGVDAFRVLYRFAGFGLVARFTELPLISNLADSLYDWFARNRHSIVPRLSGGEPCEVCKIPSRR